MTAINFFENLKNFLFSHSVFVDDLKKFFKLSGKKEIEYFFLKITVVRIWREVFCIKISKSIDAHFENFRVEF